MKVLKKKVNALTIPQGNAVTSVKSVKTSKKIIIHDSVNAYNSIKINDSGDTDKSIKAQKQIKIHNNIKSSNSITINNPDRELYSGDYSITPDVNEDQIISTSSKVMKRDLIVEKIPYYEVSNKSGKTIIIGN